MKEKIYLAILIFVNIVLLTAILHQFQFQVYADDKYIQFKEQQNEAMFHQQTKQYLGDYRVTFYCSCSSCCGQWAGSATASGVMPTANHTCACGSDIPFGTVLYVEDLGEYVCEDRGVGSGCIDIYVNDHSEIPSWGLAYIATYQVQ